MGKVWSTEDVNFLIENYDLYSGKVLANILGRSVAAIQTRAKVLGLHLSDIEKKIRYFENGRRAFERINGGYGENNLNQSRGPRKTNAEYKRIQKARHPDHDNCREMTRYLVRTGKIVKSACEVCGDVNVEAHHEDYSNPLNVRWLCRKHHREIHSE